MDQKRVDALRCLRESEMMHVQECDAMRLYLTDSVREQNMHRRMKEEG